MGTRRTWTDEDIRVLREHGHEGVAAVADLLGRTRDAVTTRAFELKISLRKTGDSPEPVSQPRPTPSVPEPESDEAEKLCATCRYVDLTGSEEPCRDCGENSSRWERHGADETETASRGTKEPVGGTHSSYATVTVDVTNVPLVREIATDALRAHLELLEGELLVNDVDAASRRVEKCRHAASVL